MPSSEVQKKEENFAAKLRKTLDFRRDVGYGSPEFSVSG
jgi:hypothetical protein